MKADQIHGQPYLEANGHEGGYHCNSCLKEEGLEACSCCNMCGEQHYNHHQIREFLMITDCKFLSFRPDDGGEGAEEH